MSSPTSEPKLEVKFKPEVDLVLKAGAGAGKTTTLIRIFFEQVDHFRKTNGKWPRVVLTTFTRKATQEIRERLMAEAISREDQELFSWLQSKYYVQISTIHGILSVFLSRFGDRLNLVGDFKLVDEISMQKLKKTVLHGLFDSHPEFVDLLEEFSFLEILSMAEEYIEASSFGTIHRLTGEELTSQLQLEIQQWSNSVKAWMNEATNQELNPSWKNYVEYWNPIKNLASDLASNYLLLQNLLEEIPRKPSHSSGKSKVSDDFDNMASEIKAELKTLVQKKLSFASRVEVFERVSKILEEVFVGFKLALRLKQSETGLITMQELEQLSAEVLRLDPESGNEFSKNFDYWMIDEYQDTSPLQVFLLNSLKGQKSHFVVGDPQQSIYLFRGARAEVFQTKIDEIQKSGGDFHRQLINYRSRKEVLNMINRYFESTSDQFESMQVGAKITAPAEPSLFLYPPPIESQAQEWTPESAVSRILELLAAGTRPEDICVLSRNHRNLKNIAKVAGQYSVPFYLHSVGNYYRQREVIDALSLLRFLDNPHDNLNFISLLRSPWFLKLDDEIVEYCTGSSYWQSSSNRFPSDRVIQQLATALAERNEIGDLAVFRKLLLTSGMIESAYQLDPSGQREANLWKLVNLCESQQNRGAFQISEFFEKANRTSGADGSSEDREPAAVIEPSRVQLMTIHAAKGLQFPHIIIAGFGDEAKSPTVPNWCFSEEKLKWTISMRDLESAQKLTTPLAYEVNEIRKKREQSESERLLYVALTRAQESVTLIWSKTRPRSWAATFPWSIELGRHEEIDFCYEVRDKTILNEMTQSAVKDHIAIPLPWMDLSLKKPETTSVTDLLNQKGQNTESSSGLKIPNFEKSKKGQRAHRIFEWLKFNIQNPFNNDFETEMNQAIEYVLSLEEPNFRKLLPLAHVEWGFSVPWGQQKLIGQIDLWAHFDGQLWVIDYKTGATNSAEKSMQQLSIYAKCLFKTKRVDDNTPISLCAIYPMDKKIFLKKYKSRKDLQSELVR